MRYNATISGTGTLIHVYGNPCIPFPKPSKPRGGAHNNSQSFIAIR